MGFSALLQQKGKNMIVLGIDPGYAIVGYGVIEMKNNRYRTLEHGAVTTKAGVDFNRRLEIIYDGVSDILAQYDLVVKKMAALKAEGKEKTVTYRQLLTNKLQYQTILSYYQVYGLLNKDEK